jgi:hypothetical protein
MKEDLRLGQQYDLLKTISKRVPILHQQARRQAERMTPLKNRMQKTLVAPQINRCMLKDIYTQLASEEARAGLLADELENHEKISNYAMTDMDDAVRTLLALVDPALDKQRPN